MEFEEKYELGEKLGSGSAGDVYLATRRKGGGKVAVKFTASASGIPQERERFAEEVRYLTVLRSPYIVRVYDAGIYEGRLFYVMEFVEGSDLSNRLREKGTFSVRDTAGLVASIAQGLATLHAGGVVHRDLKPANVMIGRDGKIRIADFGLAKGTDSRVRTKTGILLGTPGFMAPEIFLGEKAGAPADIYALGGILYRAAVGEALFSRENLSEFVKAQMLGPTPEQMQRVPQELQQLFRSMIRNAPEARPEAQEVVRSAAAILRGDGPGAPVPLPTQAMDSTATALRDAVGPAATAEISRDQISTGAQPALTPQPTVLAPEVQPKESPPIAKSGTFAPRPEASALNPSAVPPETTRPLPKWPFLLFAGLGLALGAWFIRAPSEPVPVPAAAVMPVARHRHDDAVEALLNKVMSASLHAVFQEEEVDPEVDVERALLASHLDRWRNALVSRGTRQVLRQLSDLLTEEWWRFESQEAEAQAGGLRLRRRLVRGLLELRGWNEYFVQLEAEEPFDGLAGLLAPVLRFPPEQQGAAKDLDRPGVSIRSGCDSPGPRLDNSRCLEWQNRMTNPSFDFGTFNGEAQTYCADLMVKNQVGPPVCDRALTYPIPLRANYQEGDWWIVSFGVGFLGRGQYLELVLEDDLALGGAPLAMAWRPGVLGDQGLASTLTWVECRIHRSLLAKPPRTIQVKYRELPRPVGFTGFRWWTLAGLWLRRGEAGE